MSRQTERENFILAMDKEGVPVGVARLLLRHAASLQRIAELECSSAEAMREMSPCPTRSLLAKSCLCRDHGTFDSGVPVRHGQVPWLHVREDQLQRRILALLKPYGVQPVFGGDPRGAVVKLKVPSGRTTGWGQEGISVP